MCPVAHQNKMKETNNLTQKMTAKKQNNIISVFIKRTNHFHTSEILFLFDQTGTSLINHIANSSYITQDINKIRIMSSFIISHQKHISVNHIIVCMFWEKTVLPFEASMSSVLQVWIRRTSSCRRALLYPAGGALATDRPVRSRSSAVPAASNDPASRRSSDGPGYVRPSSTTWHLLLLFFVYTPLPSACQASRCTQLFTLFISYSIFMAIALAGVVLHSALRRSISEFFELLGTFLQNFHWKGTCRRGRRSFVCIRRFLRASRHSSAHTSDRFKRPAEKDHGRDAAAVWTFLWQEGTVE